MHPAAKAARDLRRTNPYNVSHPPTSAHWVEDHAEAHALYWRANEFTIAEAERHCAAQRNNLYRTLSVALYSPDEIAGMGVRDWRVLTPELTPHREVVCPDCEGQGSLTVIGGPGYYSKSFGNYLPSEREVRCPTCDGYETIDEPVTLPAFLLGDDQWT